MLPEGIPTVTVTGRFLRPDGNPLSGQVVFRAPALLTFSDYDVIVGGPVTAPLDAQGAFTVELPATDAPGMNPSNWAYSVAEQFTGVAQNRVYQILLPSATPAVDLADIAPTDPATPTYVPVEGASAYEVAVDNGFVGTETEWLASLQGEQGPQPPLGAAGTGPDVALRSDDSTTTDARTPTAHAGSHAAGGGDPVTPSAIGAYPATGGPITGTVTVNTPAVGDAVLALHVGAETFDRARLLTDRIEMGPGTGARDTNLRRSAVNELTTDDALIVALMFRHLGTTLGFYGAAATAKPTVTGARSDGTALASLLTALATLGLVTDNTTA